MTQVLTIAMADRAVAIEGDPVLLDHVESRYLTGVGDDSVPVESIELMIADGARPDPPESSGRTEFDGSVLVVEDHRARLCIRPDLYRQHLSTLLPLAIAHLANAHGWVALHAAAVADERCVVVLGPTGAGKSTLSIVAARHGCDVLGDDQVLVRLRDGSVEVGGVGRRVSAPSAIARSNGHDGVAMVNDPRNRIVVGSLPLADGWRPLAGSVLIGDHEGEPAPMAAPRFFGQLLESVWVAAEPELLASSTKILRAVAEAPRATVPGLAGGPTADAWHRIATMLEIR